MDHKKSLCWRHLWRLPDAAPAQSRVKQGSGLCPIESLQEWRLHNLSGQHDTVELTTGIMTNKSKSRLSLSLEHLRPPLPTLPSGMALLQTQLHLSGRLTHLAHCETQTRRWHHVSSDALTECAGMTGVWDTAPNSYLSPKSEMKMCQRSFPHYESSSL